MIHYHQDQKYVTPETTKSGVNYLCEINGGH